MMREDKCGRDKRCDKNEVKIVCVTQFCLQKLNTPTVISHVPTYTHVYTQNKAQKDGHLSLPLCFR